MKTIIITAVGLIITFGTYYYFDSDTVNYVRQVVEVEKIVKVDSLETLIKEAKEEAMASTTEKAQEAYDKVFNAEMKLVADRVTEARIAELEATITNPEY